MWPWKWHWRLLPYSDQSDLRIPCAGVYQNVWQIIKESCHAYLFSVTSMSFKWDSRETKTKTYSSLSCDRESINSSVLGMSGKLKLETPSLWQPIRFENSQHLKHSVCVCLRALRDVNPGYTCSPQNKCMSVWVGRAQTCPCSIFTPPPAPRHTGKECRERRSGAAGRVAACRTQVTCFTALNRFLVYDSLWNAAKSVTSYTKDTERA